MLKGKTVIIGISGSIAAYKMADVVSTLVKNGCEVYVLMTKNATEFINPITFETLTSHKCLIDTFDRNFNYNIEHVALADKADVFLAAPATANIIGKLAGGIADDMLTTTAIACHCPKLIAPAMNSNMFTSPVVQANLEALKGFGYEIIEPESGHLACGTNGQGRLPSTDILIEHICYAMEFEKDMTGRRVLVTAGPTREHFDPVRYITNHSTGKMGYAIAKVAMRRGADVTLIAGPTALPDPIHMNVIHVETAQQMSDAVESVCDEMDIIVMSAAVSDYTPAIKHDSKLKKSDDIRQIELKKTKDILARLGSRKRQGQFICGFAMETEDLINNAKKKLSEKNADMIVANNLHQEGAGFGVDTNVMTLITKDGTNELPLMSKLDGAAKILNTIVSFF